MSRPITRFSDRTTGAGARLQLASVTSAKAAKRCLQRASVGSAEPVKGRWARWVIHSDRRVQVGPSAQVEEGWVPGARGRPFRSEFRPGEGGQRLPHARRSHVHHQGGERRPPAELGRAGHRARAGSQPRFGQQAAGFPCWGAPVQQDRQPTRAVLIKNRRLPHVAVPLVNRTQSLHGQRKDDPGSACRVIDVGARAAEPNRLAWVPATRCPPVLGELVARIESTCVQVSGCVTSLDSHRPLLA